MQPTEHPMPPERRLARRLLTPSRRCAAYLDRRARAILATLTPHEKLGQLLVPIIFPVGPHDLHVTDELRAALAASVLRILRFKLDRLGAELARATASVGGENVA